MCVEFAKLLFTGVDELLAPQHSADLHALLHLLGESTSMFDRERHYSIGIR